MDSRGIGIMIVRIQVRLLDGVQVGMHRGKDKVGGKIIGGRVEDMKARDMARISVDNEASSLRSSRTRHSVDFIINKYVAIQLEKREHGRNG